VGLAILRLLLQAAFDGSTSLIRDLGIWILRSLRVRRFLLYQKRPVNASFRSEFFLADVPTLGCDAQVCEQGGHQEHDDGGSEDEAFSK
jgi:hypothetical protein